MRNTICLPLLALLAACAPVVPPQAWTFDPTQPQPKLALSTAEAAALTDRVAQLKLQRQDIRSQIATEPDALKRQGQYERLHAVGTQLSPLERRLAAVASGR